MKKRSWSILLVLCMVLALLPVVSTPAQAAVIGNDYPYNGESSGMDPWLFVKGNCTSFVAWRLNNTNGVAFNDYYGGVEWGNASNWGYAAQQIGITVDMNPTVGSVAWNSFGHVAWVAEVRSSTVVVEEYNWDYDYSYHVYERAISHYSGFIHIKDLDAFNPDSNTLESDFYGYLMQKEPWIHVVANGDNVELAAKGACIPKQIWHFVELSDGSYKIINEYDGRLMDVTGAGTEPGTNVGLYIDHDHPAQHWWIHDFGGGKFLLRPVHCDLGLDVKGGATDVDGTNIQVYTRNGTMGQRFQPYPLKYDGITYVKPDRPQPSTVLLTEAVAGETTTITWTESPLVNRWDERTYNVRVFDADGNDVHTALGVTGTSYTYTFPEPGTYSVRITAVNTMYDYYLTVGTPKTVTVSAPEPPNPFTDVAKGKYYYDAVLWAVNQDPQVTSGYSDGTFRPDQTCTRAQVVTFLWRAKGCPEPTTTVNPFKDVRASAYYYKAVLWAVENHITTGYADGTFRPDGECTRAHVVTFLWRLEGSPAPESASNPFKDVPAGQFYTNAALWAVENNITTGYADGTFRPETACTRGHVVAFLYRAYN